MTDDTRIEVPGLDSALIRDAGGNWVPENDADVYDAVNALCDALLAARRSRDALHDAGIATVRTLCLNDYGQVRLDYGELGVDAVRRLRAALGIDDDKPAAAIDAAKEAT